MASTVMDRLTKTIPEARIHHIGLRVEKSVLRKIDILCKRFSVSRSELSYIALEALIEEMDKTQNSRKIGSGNGAVK